MTHQHIRRGSYSLLALAFALALCADSALAQKVIPAPEARVSPMSVAAKKLDDGTYVRLVYSSPRRQDPESGQDRAVFGGLVPYGEVWRLGANEATEIITTGDISFAGQRLPAGTYSVFAIPQQDKWTLILNKELGQWGAFQYKQASDVFRVDVPVQTTADTYDAFSIGFDENDPNLNVVWENAHVVVPISAL